MPSDRSIDAGISAEQMAEELDVKVTATIGSKWADEDQEEEVKVGDILLCVLDLIHA
jgi:hypothetical protein